jgi:hypothetical protein
MSDTVELADAAETIEPEVVSFDFDTSDLEARWETRMETMARELRNQIANMIPGAEPAPSITLNEAQTAMLRMVAANPAESRALADVIGTAPGNASGLIHDALATELLGILNATRPFLSAAGSYPWQDAGYGVEFPRIVQHTLVGPRGAEKTEIPTREFTVDVVRFAKQWFAGGVDIAMELILSSTPDALESVLADMRDQYAIATETAFVDAVETAATVGGATLPTTDWATFAAAVIATSSEIRQATGQPGNRLALTTATWQAVVGLLNPGSPASLPGPGAPDFTAESVDLRGLTVFHSPDSSADVQFNTKSLRVSEMPPLSVTANNVALMGRDVGILGGMIPIPAYPAGIVKYTALGMTAAKAAK